MQQKPILWIRSKVGDGEYKFTVHCLERRIERYITRKEVEDAIFNGEIIEDYPDDKYRPSCLILGFTNQGRPIHIQCSLDPVWIITCYDPSERPDEWNENFKKRR